MDAPTPKPGRRSRLPAVTLFVTLVLALTYVAAYQPLARRAESLDKSLRLAWEQFAATNRSSEATAGVKLENLGARLKALDASAADLAALRLLIDQRLALPADVRDQLQAPFQLIDFENERLLRAESLAALAKQQKVVFEPGATNGLPQYLGETGGSALLWPRLYFATQVLLLAAHTQVGSVRELTQLPDVDHRSAFDGHREFQEMPMRITLVGDLEPVGRFLTSLPLRGAELEATGLATVLTNKPALFIDHLLTRKAAPDRPGDVLVEVEVSGFVPLAGTVLQTNSPAELTR